MCCAPTGTEGTSSGPSGLKISPMGRESHSLMLPVWPTSLAGTGSYCELNCPKFGSEGSLLTWKTTDVGSNVSYEPWRDFKRVWHWRGTNCSELLRSTGTKSCQQSLILPFEFVQLEPSTQQRFPTKEINRCVLCSPSPSPADSDVSRRADWALCWWIFKIT